MKIPRHIDGSICGVILPNRLPLCRPTTIGPGHVLAGISMRCFHGISSVKLRHHMRRLPIVLFHHPPVSPRRAVSHGNFFQSTIPSPCQSHTATAATDPDFAPQSELHGDQQKHTGPTSNLLTQEQLLALVDNYDDDSNLDDHMRILQDPYRRGYAPPDGPKVQVHKKPHDFNYPSLDDVLVPDEETKHLLETLAADVDKRLRMPYRVELDQIFRLYEQIPKPRMAYIHADLRHRLLRALGNPYKKTFRSMVQYFAVVADVKDNGLLLSLSEWNNAVALASRYVGKSTEVEAHSALKLWREMEQESKTRANEVTFNILFDVASKAGNFVLAEMLYKEMVDRGYSFNRYHRVSLIHFFGLRRDSNGLRAAYRDMVLSGEMIDTLTLNCVIAGLLRCGEEDSAEYVYNNMKALSSSGAALPGSPMTNKAITRVLMMFARIGREHPEMRPRLQSPVRLGPDLATYRILVLRATEIGDLSLVARYLEDMQKFAIPTHGAIFLALFKGFQRHGGFPGSAWSEQRLLNVWNAFLRALDDGTDNLKITNWMVSSILAAFNKCSNAAKVRTVYDELAMRWDLNDVDEHFIASFYANLR